MFYFYLFTLPINSRIHWARIEIPGDILCDCTDVCKRRHNSSILVSENKDEIVSMQQTNDPAKKINPKKTKQNIKITPQICLKSSESWWSTEEKKNQDTRLASIMEKLTVFSLGTLADSMCKARRQEPGFCLGREQSQWVK